MKIKLLLLVSIFLIISCGNNTNNSNDNLIANETEKVANQLRHVVLFKFKTSATASDIQNVEAAFDGLPLTILEIKDYEWGLNNSPENLDKGFTHCFFLTFNSEKDRDTYLTHPDHLAFGKVLMPHLDDVLVIDYWNK